MNSELPLESRFVDVLGRSEFNAKSRSLDCVPRPRVAREVQECVGLRSG